jgi:hypothetical protein
MFRTLPRALLALLLLASHVSGAAGDTCTAESFGAAVDEAAEGLRKFNAEAQPELKQKLERLKDKKGWGAANYEEKGLNYLRDDRIAAFDAQADELFTKIDTLGRPEPGAPVNCANLAELKAAGSELLALMKTKSAYLTEKLDKELSGPAAAATPAVPQTPTPVAPEAKSREKQAGKAPSERLSNWDTTTSHSPSTSEQPPQEPPVQLPEPSDTEDGFTIDEVREASRGFFGTLSANLGSVIEHAFHKVGRPTAYVLGTEGGGALLAGLRYGKGTLYLRSGGDQEVYWHGPSLGYDLGAEGSRTLFLIYRLREPKYLFRMFTGIDGTAFLVGGVGITFLKGGEVIMAPIRSGLGLRLGASIGYVRFTSRPTWNPF